MLHKGSVILVFKVVRYQVKESTLHVYIYNTLTNENSKLFLTIQQFNITTETSVYSKQCTVKPHLSGPHLSRLFTYPDTCFGTKWGSTVLQ